MGYNAEDGTNTIIEYVDSGMMTLDYKDDIEIG